MRAAIAEFTNPSKPGPQNSCVGDPKAFGNHLLMSAFQKLVVPRSQPEAPCLDNNPKRHSFAILLVPEDAVLRAAGEVLFVVLKPSSPVVLRPATLLVLIVLKVARIDKAFLFVGNWIKTAKLMGDHCAEVNLNSLNGIENG
jgi:hypothetical protein